MGYYLVLGYRQYRLIGISVNYRGKPPGLSLLFGIILSMKYLFGLTLIFGVVFLTPGFINEAKAQITEDIIGKSLFIETSTPYPAPNSHVDVSLNDYAYGRTVTSISWFVNGVEMTEVKNERRILLSVGGVGQITEVVAKVTTGNNTTDTTSLTLRPLFVDIIVEAQTRVPGFYKGRSLPSNGSVVSAAVILGGVSAPAEDFTYTWELNNRPIDGGGMRGKNKVNFITPAGNDFILSVNISDMNGQLIAKRAIIIPSVEPSVSFYESSSLYGLRPIATSDIILIGETSTIKAEPYNLDLLAYNNPEHLIWEINNTPTTNPSSNPYELTVARSGTVSRSTTIGFEVRSLSNLLQGSKGSLNINY
jgi:hypothetical protein